jgi:monoamine oxidase
LAFIHAVYEPTPGTNEVWFNGIPAIVTDDILRHIIPIDKKRGIIMLSYLASGKHIDHYEKLYETSGELFYDDIKRHLTKLFPNINIPKPVYLNLRSWTAGTYRWTSDADYCNIYQKIIHPVANTPLYLSNESYSYRGGWMEGSLEIADKIIHQIIS